MVAMTTSGASCGAEDIKSAMGPYCMSTKVLPASFFPNCPRACPRSVWTLEVPRQILLLPISHFGHCHAHLGALVDLYYTGPKVCNGLHQNVSGHHGSFGGKKIPKDGLGQWQTCKKEEAQSSTFVLLAIRTHC
jgi:hypothetical protein